MNVWAVSVTTWKKLTFHITLCGEVGSGVFKKRAICKLSQILTILTDP